MPQTSRVASLACVAGLLSLLGCPSRSLTITTPELPDAFLQAPYQQQLEATGGQPPLKWSLKDLPPAAAWLGIDEAQGMLLSLTPPTELVDGLHLFIHVEDAQGSAADRELILNVRDCQGDSDLACAQTADGGVCDLGIRHCQGGHSDGCQLAGPSTDLKACGPECGNCATSGDACVDGKCVCGGAQTVCAQGQSCCGGADGGTCVSTSTDPANCGLCGAVCDNPQAPHTVPACADGVCQFQRCEQGWGRCGADANATGCPSRVDNDVNNCGACGNHCPVLTDYTPDKHVTGVVCTNSGCQLVCASLYADCDGNLVNGCETFANTPDHCGSCSACPTPGPNVQTVECSDGVCQADCAGGWDRCGLPYAAGCPIDTQSDPDNCNGCGTVCPQLDNDTAICQFGSCKFVCQPGFVDCDGVKTNGCEVDTNSDPFHCGSCTHVCAVKTNENATCTNGDCGVMCKAGTADCNGLESDGCEINTNQDLNNCGACRHKCPDGSFSDPACNDGTCGLNCEAGHGDCNHDGSDGCEANLHTDEQNCGACGVVCSSGRICGTCAGGTYCCR